MQKKISFSTQGQRADIGDLAIYRLLPNRYADAVGPFVFLDHLAPISTTENTPRKKDGTGAHPHRGIATLTYILSGEGEHFDSRGNHGKIYSGGIQWMKAGNGIIHDETMKPDSKSGSNYLHGFQFWINLPSQVKEENPEYLAISGDEVPIMQLTSDAGWLKVIVGKYDGLVSKIPNYSDQYLYHIHLNKGKRISLETKKGLEYAALVAKNNVLINDTEFQEGDFVEFDRDEGVIEIDNRRAEPVDILVFGGEQYVESIVAEGPFVMNSKLEVAKAYEDFFGGRYGTINYPAESPTAF